MIINGWDKKRNSSKREVESMRMLNEILSASKSSAKRAVISKFNPHFYLLFPDGVKRYAQENELSDTQSIGSQAPDGETSEVALRLDGCRDVSQDSAEARV